MKINLILPTYENEDLTLKCLRSIKKYLDKNYEPNIIWVDNGSSEKSKNQILKYLKSNLSFDNIYLECNVGFIKAVNIGLKFALEKYPKNKFIGIINNDIEVSNDWLKNLIDCFKDDVDDKVQCVGSLCYDSNINDLTQFDKRLIGDEINNISDHNFIEYVNKISNLNCQKYVEFNYSNFKKDNFTYTYVPYYSVIFRTSIFQKIGFLNENYNLGYADDTEFNYRICENGFTIRKAIKSIVNHIGKSTFKLLYDENKIFNIQESNRKQLRISKMLNQDSSKKNVIYTCISGNYDRLIELSNVDTKNFDYICFTNSDLLLEKNIFPWKIINVKDFNIDIDLSDTDYYVKFARFFKLHPHLFFEKYENSIWIDGNINVIGNLSEYLNFLNDFNYLAIPIHPFRNNIYEEIFACNRLGKETNEKLNIINKFLINENFPRNTNLVQSGVLLRKHNDDKCIFMMNKWWEMIKNYSKRDQLSFNYVFWKYGGKYLGIPWDLLSKTYFTTNYRHGGTK